MSTVLSLLGAIFLSLWVWQRRTAPHPEIPRKLAHIGMGVVTLSFPWLFRDVWPVWTLAILATSGLLAAHYSQPLRQGIGAVVNAVARRSAGDMYFPLAVAILFTLTGGSPLFYCVPLMLLVFSDAAAALIGVRYGRTPYSTTDGFKSVEGSIAFFVIGYFCTHIPLLLGSETGRAESLLIAGTLALLVTLMEGIAWAGLDNLIVPLAAFLLLRIFVHLDLYALTLRFGIAMGLVAGVLMLRHRAALIGDGLLGAALFGYAAWALGGRDWLLIPMTVFISYPLLSPPTAGNTQPIHGIAAVLGVCFGPALWLFLSQFGHWPALIQPFALAFCAHLAIIAYVRYRYDYPKRSARSLLVASTCLAWLIVYLPLLVAQGFPTTLLTGMALAPVGVLIALVGFSKLQPGLENCPSDALRWVRQGALATFGSLVGLVPGLVIHA